jgi:hypothetical protein
METHAATAFARDCDNIVDNEAVGERSSRDTLRIPRFGGAAYFVRS